ncbi:hypothetical protein NPS53_08140 [Pseudomonas putida]|uniref:hypothetical protein n=1 Tax=Pseudomonas putida TaxID=303 RepID=UPI002363D021|nr:hypothetical protein [Pseudomonas putida]MDD2139540.1 hypothetical protein [Pseudomonas putida]HDS1721463.1 hypothetical protein [Pseudomonas putida]
MTQSEKLTAQPAQASSLPVAPERAEAPGQPPVDLKLCSPELLATGVDCTVAPRRVAGAIEDHWHPPVGMATLNAYEVGDCDIVAAWTSDGAIAVLCEQTGEGLDEYELGDAVLVSDKTLDNLEVFDQDEGRMVTLGMSLRQELALLSKPTYLYGRE